MPHFCCVVNCGSRSNRDNVQFYRIPKALNFRHKVELNELSALRRQKWINAIRRADLTSEKIENARVCSKHFVSGKPAELTDKLNPDWVPSVNMGYTNSGKASSSTQLQRYERSSKRQKVVVVEESAVEVAEMRPSVSEITRDVEEANCKNIQTELTMEKLTDMFLNLTFMQDMQNKLDKLTLTYESLCGNDVKTRYYTGLPTCKVLEIVVKYIEPYIHVHPNTVLTAKNQILLTLVKLRLNADYKDLGYRFGISLSTASTYFKNTLHIMCLRFKNFVFWPDRSILMKTMPSCFKEAFHQKTTVIIDCFEIRTQTPSHLLTAAESWSSYKHSQTIKYLIGITPQGSVCFISEGWGGRVSDKFLTEHSAFLNHLLPGDVVMADRGFLIKKFLEIFHVTVKVPAFTKGKTQLHPVDLESTRAIAHVRIHVERVIGLVRQKYCICTDIVPVDLLSTGGHEPLLDEIIFVCCALINICPPIVPL